jgi:cell division protein FtsW
MFGYAGCEPPTVRGDRFSKLLAAGLTSLIMAQAALNLFAVLGLAPLTGVPCRSSPWRDEPGDSRSPPPA